MALTADAKKLREEQDQKQRERLSDRHEMDQMIIHTLGNFAYRYLQTDGTGELEVVYRDDNTLVVQAIETSMVHALKTENQELRKGLIDLARSFKKSDGPTVRYQLICHFDDWNDRGFGTLKIESQVDWGFPDFSQKEKRMGKKSYFKI